MEHMKDHIIDISTKFEQNRLSGSKVIGFCSLNGGHIGSHDGGHLEFLNPTNGTYVGSYNRYNYQI